jgi:putative glutamine amidotransferase
MKHKPMVLVPACNRLLGHHPFHVAGRKYLDAVRLAGCLPLIAASTTQDDIAQWLDLADGVLLTGSQSNVHPSHFGEPVHDETLPLDRERDDWTLRLIPAALDRGIPLLGICRGFQEANVALGGSLHQAVHEVPGQHDHRGATDVPPEATYGPAHAVEVMPGGLLADIVGTRPFVVNSVHGQGLNRVAEGLRIEARAPDGLVEAFSVAQAPAFNLCVQWHPEWQAAGNPQSMKLFEAFGRACQAYRERHRPSPEPDR